MPFSFYSQIINKFVHPRNTWTEMYAGRVACCPLVSHVECAPLALLKSEKSRDRQTDRRTDGQTPLRFPLDAASVITVSGKIQPRHWLRYKSRGLLSNCFGPLSLY